MRTGQAVVPAGLRAATRRRFRRNAAHPGNAGPGIRPTAGPDTTRTVSGLSSTASNMGLPLASVTIESGSKLPFRPVQNALEKELFVCSYRNAMVLTPEISKGLRQRRFLQETLSSSSTM